MLLKNYVDEHKSANTKRKIRSAVNRFQTWIDENEKERSKPIEDYEPRELNHKLGAFIMTLKKKDGTEYEPDTVASYVRSINSHLKTVGYSEVLLTSDEFGLMRDVLDSKKKDLKDMGKGNRPNRAEAITDDNEEIQE